MSGHFQRAVGGALVQVHDRLCRAINRRQHRRAGYAHRVARQPYYPFQLQKTRRQREKIHRHIFVDQLFVPCRSVGDGLFCAGVRFMKIMLYKACSIC